MSALTRLSFAFALVFALASTGCDRVDQKKFDAVYRAGKALEVDMENTHGVYVSESEKLLKQLQTETSLLDGRTSGQGEADALRTYAEAADAYKHFLTLRSLDLHGDTLDGRLLLGDGWVPVAAKYHLTMQAHPDNGKKGEYNFYWMDLGEAITVFSAAGKKGLTDASRLVNGQS